MKKQRVLLLCHRELVPLDSIEGLSDEEISEWRTEFDVKTTLQDLGHEVEVCGLADDVEPLRGALEELRPDVCFNLIVEFHDEACYDQHVVSYLELLRQPYTGCNPRGMTLARDKALSKKILAHDGVPVPRFALFRRGKPVKRPRDLEFPLFVKSAVEEASLGISNASIVRSDAKLAERVAFVHENVGTDAIAEEYVDGREFYVGVLGNERIRTFPVWELHIPGLPEGAPRIATRRVKWDIGYQRRIGIRNRRAEIDPALERRLQDIARRTYRSLGLSGYARLDLRMRPDGRVYVLEANPNPDVTYGEDFAETAEAGGLSYEVLIQRILRLGLEAPYAWRRAALSV